MAPDIVYNGNMKKGKTRGPRSAAADAYYRLDNGAVFMAAIAGASGPFVFRVSCDFRETIRLEPLSSALRRLAPRFPFLFVSLRSGVFWHYLDPIAGCPRVEAEDPYPARRIPYRPNRPLVRVVAYGRRLACEFHHAVTDGTGAFAFLRSLAAEYLRLAFGVEDGSGEAGSGEAGGPLLRPDEPVDEAEEEDAYARYFRSSAPLPDKVPKAFLIPGRRRLEGYRETLGVLPLAAALAAAKARRATLTELLVAVHAAALQDLYEALPERKRRKAKKTISIQVPINLRKIYPSRTLRNFFLFAAVSFDLRLGRWSFDEILRRTHHQLRIGLEEKELLRQLKRNVGGERNLFGRPMFLPIKTIVMRAINAAIGVGAYSGSLSNVGAVELPLPFAERVARFGLLAARARATGANVTVLSWKDDVFVNVGSLVRDREFERAFFVRLARMGIPTRVESSEAYYEGE